MTFGVLNTAPKRFTLTKPAVDTVSSDVVLPQKRIVRLTAETTIQQPQPQQPRSKIEQLTGYDLDSPQSPPSARRVLKKDSISSISSEGSSSCYSQKAPKVDTTVDTFNDWGNWTPVDYSPAKRNPTDSFYGDRRYSISAMDIAPSTRDGMSSSLRTRDRPQTPSNGGLASGKAEPFSDRPAKTMEDVIQPTRTWRQFSFDDDFDEPQYVPQPLHPENYFATPRSFVPYGADDLEQDGGVLQESPLDETTYKLHPLALPEIPFTDAPRRQQVDNFSRFSNSSSDSGGIISNTRDSVMLRVRTIVSPFRLPDRPISIFRDRLHKPTSIRVPSPALTTSTRSRASTRRSGLFSSGNHPLKSPFPARSSDTAERQDEDDEHDDDDDDDEKTFANRLSSAFRSLSSKADSPTSPAKDIIKTRIIHTSARRQNGPDTPFPTKFKRRSSFPDKLKNIGVDVQDNVVKSGKAAWGKGISVLKGVGDMASGKTTFEERSGAKRREKMLKSIKVVRMEEAEVRGSVGNVRVESLQEAKQRMDLWV